MELGVARAETRLEALPFTPPAPAAGVDYKGESKWVAPASPEGLRYRNGETERLRGLEIDH